jgi:hypothetical protein
MKSSDKDVFGARLGKTCGFFRQQQKNLKCRTQRFLRRSPHLPRCGRKSIASDAQNLIALGIPYFKALGMDIEDRF